MQVQYRRSDRQIVGVGEFPAGSPDPDIEIAELSPGQLLYLRQPGTKTLQPDGTIVVTPPPPPPVVFSAEAPLAIGKIVTTNATPVEVWRLTLAPTTGYKLRVEWLAVDGANGAIKTQETRATIERLLAGPLLIGRTDDPPHATTGAPGTAAGVTNWTIASAFVGNDLVLSAIGAAGRTVSWDLSGSIRSFAPGGLPP